MYDFLCLVTRKQYRKGKISINQSIIMVDRGKKKIVILSGFFPGLNLITTLPEFEDINSFITEGNKTKTSWNMAGEQEIDIVKISYDDIKKIVLSSRFGNYF